MPEEGRTSANLLAECDEFFTLAYISALRTPLVIFTQYIYIYTINKSCNKYDCPNFSTQSAYCCLNNYKQVLIITVFQIIVFGLSGVPNLLVICSHKEST